MRNIFACLLIEFVFVGCATPYQRVNGDGLHRTGYEETKLTTDKFRIRYLDKDSMLAYRRFLRRASEITLENGGKSFKILDQGANQERERGAVVGGLYQSMALPQFEATIQIFQISPLENGFDARETLDTAKKNEK